MKRKYDKYPSYKPSGIEWLGEAPEHWKIQRLKYVSIVQSSNVDKKSKEDEDEVLLCNYVDVYKNEYIDDSIFFMKATAPKRQIERYLLKKGDVLITKDSEDRFDIAVPAKVNQQLENVLCGYHLAQIRPKNELIDDGFLFRWLQSDSVNDQFKVSANGITRFGLSVSSIKDSVVVLPPLKEQQTIAALLDHQTTRIDRLIQKKKRLLELLNEQRQAIITRAVTKGIKPGVPMKDSGIEWLGKVPEHWGLNRLKFYAQINPVKSEVSSLPDDFLVTFTPMEAVKEFGGLDTSVEKPKEEVYQGYTYFKDGDVLTAKITPCFENGKAAIAESLKNGIGFGTTELHVLRAGKKLDNRFLFYMIISEPFLKVGESEMLGAGGQKRVRQEFIENWIWAFPPVDEQKSIVHFIEKQSSKIDQLKSKIQTAIEKLEEYRSSLITQTVTGKIDVREKTSQKKTKKKRANIYFKRTVLAVRILDELHAEPTMGRIKLQKILYLLEKHIEKIQLAGKYVKAAAGPFDNKLMRSIEKQLKDRSWFIKSGRKNGYGYKYIPGANKEGYMEYYPRYWGDVESEISNFLDLVRTEKTDLLSYAATLYACWNDFLIKEVDFDGKKLINESRYNWHEEKKEIPYKDWKAALNWLWNNNIKPSGSGDLTKEL